MNSSEYLEKHLATIIDTARYAPSAHNAQPWQVSRQGNTLRVFPLSTLVEGDPTGRQTVIGLGIFTEALIIVAAAHGLEMTSVTPEQDGGAVIAFNEKLSTPKSENLPELLKSRVTDRSVYQPARLPDSLLKELSAISAQRPASLHVITDKPILNKLAALTSKGIQLALSSPRFRQELRNYLVLPGSSKRRGISVRSLYIAWPLEMLQPLLIRFGIGTGSEVKLEKRRWASASAVIAITTDGDMPPYWLEAGRTYLRASLAVERSGLSQATSAAIVEASDFHEDIEQLLKTTERIQAVIRIGKGSSKRYRSPRVEVNEILTT